MNKDHINTPHHLSYEDKKRYLAIKTKIMARIYVPREDFLFIKAADFRDNRLHGNWRKFNRRIHDNVSYGMDTTK